MNQFLELMVFRLYQGCYATLARFHSASELTVIPDANMEIGIDKYVIVATHS